MKGLQITRETDYAIRTVLYLAGKESYTTKSEAISKEMQIPKSFLMKILRQLEKKGLVKSKRGVNGGVTLIKKPEEITLYDIVVAMEKAVVLNRCMTNKTVCGRVSYCPVHPVLFKVRNKLIEALQEVNFSDLIVTETAY